MSNGRIGVQESMSTHPRTHNSLQCDLRRTLRAQEVEYGVIDMVG